MGEYGNLEPIEVNHSGSGVESCTRAYGVDIVGECLHYSIRTGPGVMKFGGSALGRVGGMQHHLIVRLAGGAVRVSVVGVGLMTLYAAKKITSNFLGEARLLYAICNDLRGLGCGMQGTWRSKGRWSSRPVAYSSGRILR